MGTVDHAVDIDRTVALRIPLMGSFSNSPHREKSGKGGAVTEVDAGPRSAPEAACLTSSAETRPSTPLPCTWLFYTPCSRARRLTYRHYRPSTTLHAHEPA